MAPAQSGKGPLITAKFACEQADTCLHSWRKPIYECRKEGSQVTTCTRVPVKQALYTSIHHMMNIYLGG